MSNPQDVNFLLDDEENFRPAIQEMARYLTPLPRMERVPREFAIGDDSERNPENYVLLGFVSANHDRERFDQPEKINFQRERNAHIAFGFGPHSCLGQNITEIETRAFLNALLPKFSGWRFSQAPEIEWVDEQMADRSITRYLDKFKKLPVSSN
jgi:cytochrome P450